MVIDHLSTAHYWSRADITGIYLPSTAENTPLYQQSTGDSLLVYMLSTADSTVIIRIYQLSTADSTSFYQPLTCENPLVYLLSTAASTILHLIATADSTVFISICPSTTDRKVIHQLSTADRTLYLHLIRWTEVSPKVQIAGRFNRKQISQNFRNCSSADKNEFTSTQPMNGNLSCNFHLKNCSVPLSTILSKQSSQT